VNHSKKTQQKRKQELFTRFPPVHFLKSKGNKLQ
jgi:hypothetical protein